MASGQPRQSQAHADTSASSLQANTLAEKLSEIANRAKSFTAAGGAAIALLQDDQFITRASCGNCSPPLADALPLPRNLETQCAPGAKVLRSSNIEGDVRFDCKSFRVLKIKSMLIVPIGELSSPAGVLAVFSSAPNAFTDTHIALLKTLAEVVHHMLPARAVPPPPVQAPVPAVSVGRPHEPGPAAEDLFEHPFNPANDHASPKSEIITESPRPAPPRRPAVQLGGIPEALDPMEAAAQRPAVPQPARPAGSAAARVPTPPPLKVPTPLPQPAAGLQPKDSDVLDLAANPFANGKPPVPKPAERPKPRTQQARVVPAPRAPRPQRRYSSPRKSSWRLPLAVAVIAVLLIAAWLLRGRIWEKQEAIDTNSAPQVQESAPPAQTPAVSLPARIESKLFSIAEASVRPDRLPTSAITLQKILPLSSSISSKQGAVPEPLAIAHDSRSATALIQKQDQADEPPQLAPLLAQKPAADPSALKVLSQVAIPAAAMPLKRSDVVPSELIHRVAPLYPARARAMHLHGTVVLSATVTKQGLVAAVRPVSGDRILSGAAMDAVRQWRYKPSLMNGEPVESNVEVVFHFKAE